uniref:Squamous cell carcinoma antigen recognized by T-cells 3-like n=1 Tax=Diabrotica virgifera virgifera TaxID=50390 RepID=A0A6P7FTK9_DIAVI
METKMSAEEENSSSSDSCNEEDDIEKDLLRQAEMLESQLSTNKYLYDVHIEVINIYRKLSDLNSMREAYQRFRECFPLTPKIWLEWIKDEIKIASTQEEQENIFSLFDAAVDDYLSVNVWIEYAQYSIGTSNIQTTRSILERGLTSAGLHVSEGSLLWDTLRELEHAHLSLYQENSEEWKSQIKRLVEVFRRQLSVPLLNMENTYQEWTDWYKSLPDGLVDSGPVEWGYKKAIQTLETYKPFEDRLISADSAELYDIYKEYIKEVKDTSTVLCLYERAILPLCLTPVLWEDYIKYCFKLREVVLKVGTRAIRNCTWSEPLWIARLRALEFHKSDEKEIMECFEQGVINISPSPPLEFWFSFLEYYHRNSDDQKKLDKLFSQAVQQIGHENDPIYKVSRWHARLLAKRGDMESARKVWNNIVNDQQNKGSVNAWLEYANLEKQYGEVNQVRNIFKRALFACKDWPQYIADEWLMLERESGTLEDIMKCEEKCKNVLRTASQYTQKNSDVQYKRDSDRSISRKRKSEEEPFRMGSKRRYEDSGRHREANEDFNFRKLRVSQETKKPQDTFTRDKRVSKPIENKDPKTTVFVSNIHPTVSEETLKELFPNALNISIVLDKNGKSRCFGYIQFSKEEECMTALARDRVPINGRPVFISELKSDKSEKKTFKYAQSTEENKLFLKGLPILKTKEDVEQIFKEYNPIDVRLITKKNGESKGIAFVDFKTAEEAQKALKEIQPLKIEDQEITVAISAPPPKKPNDKFSKPELREPIRHARSKLQVPMMPRSLLVKSSAEKAVDNGKVESVNKTTKSNADFRNMFLKK